MTKKEKFRKLALHRAAIATGVDKEWYQNEDWFDCLYNFATQHTWWKREWMWDDIIDEWEDMESD